VIDLIFMVLFCLILVGCMLVLAVSFGDALKR